MSANKEDLLKDSRFFYCIIYYKGYYYYYKDFKSKAVNFLSANFDFSNIDTQFLDKTWLYKIHVDSYINEIMDQLVIKHDQIVDLWLALA